MNVSNVLYIHITMFLMYRKVKVGFDLPLMDCNNINALLRHNFLNVCQLSSVLLSVRTCG